MQRYRSSTPDRGGDDTPSSAARGRRPGRGNAARASRLPSGVHSASPPGQDWLGADALWLSRRTDAEEGPRARQAESDSARALEHAARRGAHDAAPSTDEVAAALLGSFRAALAPARGGTAEARAATVTAADQLSYLVQGQPPEVQAAVLREAQADLARLARQVEHLSREETDRAVAALSRVAEAVGSDQVRLLTDTLARELPDVLSTKRGRTETRFLDAMQGAIEGGQGALLATAMAHSLADDGHADLAADVHERAGEAVAAVRERYDEAKAAVDARNAELALVQTTWGASLDEDARAAGMEAFLEHHADDYTELDDASGILARTLEGASYGITPPTGFEGESQASAFTSALLAIPALARTEAGSAVVVDAMARSSAGRPSFLGVARQQLDAAAQLGNTMVGALPFAGDAAAFEGGAHIDTAVMEAIAVQTDVAARQGDLGAMERMLGEFSSFTQDHDLARTATEIQAGIAEEWAEFTSSGGIVGELDALGSLGSLQSKIGKVFTETSKRYLEDRPHLRGRFDSIGLSFATGSTVSAFAALAADPDLDSFLTAGGSGARLLDARNRHNNPDFEGPTRLGRLGAGAGLLGSGINSIQNPGSVRAHLETVVDAAGYANAAQVFSSKALLGQAMKKAGMVAGVFFSAWDTLDAIERGDAYGAAASAAPLAGLAIGAAVGGPAGAALGLAIGGLVGVGMELFRAFTQKDPIVEFEQRTQPFLEAAFVSMGMGESEADQLSHRFRDVNDDLVGVGPVLAGLAGELGVSPEEMLRWASTLSDREVHDLSKRLLRVDHEGERLWEETQRPPGQGRDPRDPMNLGLDRAALTTLAVTLRRDHEGPWAALCAAP